MLGEKLQSVPEELCNNLDINKHTTFVLMVCGNVEFPVNLDLDSKTFVVADEFSKRLEIQAFVPMLLEYAGSNIFNLTLFNAEGLSYVLDSREI